MKGVIITATGEEVLTPVPNPLLALLDNSPVRSFKGFGRLKDEVEDEHPEVLDSASSPEDEHGEQDFEPSPSVVVSRMRRTSIAKFTRPLFPSLATAPAAVPTADKTPLSLEPEPSQSAPPSTIPTADDEENLPSPFLKRVERAARAGFKPASRRTSTEASKALRTAAAANAAGKAATTKPVVSSTSRVSVGRISRSPDSMRRARTK
jgi:NIMA (never in mitosis gene a)-related kinase